ncbi:MAG: DNA modification methylase, partial [Spirochaetia bacterium]|nr:DNA modification methylase [Spirochaetia bacterium]
RQELANICRRLDKERVMRRGHKHYHTMVAAYFRDMGLVWQELRRMCRGGSSVCFVIGDSAPYGVYVPAPSLLSELAEAAGFSAPRFEKIRDRNIKWKNRKHRVPLQEGRLWLKG